MSNLTRRAFTASLGAARLASAADAKPNILWITCEDIGPQLGCYGDKYSVTPALDKFAANSLRYNNAWSNAPVCAPARTTIISGVYPPSTGSEHMRSETRLPSFMRMYPQFLREAGYYATNNNKEDYNLVKPDGVWDDSSTKAHWRNRKGSQPFFSIFNFTITHESQIRRRPHTLKHDPKEARIPAYHPDTPEVRHDWAQYYDNITTMDGMSAKVLAELEQDGLAQDTIVFFYGDHGSGMPRSKRWPFNSGLQVPMMVHIPEKFRSLAPRDYKAGGTTDRLVSFVDLAPTLLSLIGQKPPEWMQGHAFMGSHAAPEQPYIYGFRGRMDERSDFVRSVRDKRYVYLRHYNPHLIYGQHVGYMFETPTTAVWAKMHDEGKLTPAQDRFWQTKPAEELFDLQSDPDEVNNLAGKPEHKATVERMRKAQQALAKKIRDVGFLPEGEIHSRAVGSTPYEVGHDDKLYPMDRIMAAAEFAASGKPGGIDTLKKNLADPDSAVRYWGAMGILMRGASAVSQSASELDKAMGDSAAAVSVAAADALAQHGDAAAKKKAVDVLVDRADCTKSDYYAAIRAWIALDMLGTKVTRPYADRLKAMPVRAPGLPQRALEYANRLKTKVTKDLG